MKRYVVGFLFSNDGKTVALIRKNKPDWQKGKLNGISGKVEEGEAVQSAMVREFKEEAGLDITEWKYFCCLKGSDKSYDSKGGQYEVYFFYAFSDEVWNVKPQEEEYVSTYRTTEIEGMNTVPNLKWLIPMALEETLVAEIKDEQ